MATAIIKGTTPTITFQFKTIDVAELSKAVLTIKADGAIKLEKDMDTATVDVQNKNISWTLSQAETLSLSDYSIAEVMLNWLTEDGLRGASGKTNVQFDPNHKEVVL